MTLIRRWSVAASAVGMLLGLVGCGGDPETPGEAVPALASTLTTVDRALAQGDHEQARLSLNKLVETAEQSREAGRISDAEADRILAAVTRLIAALPDATPPVDTPTEPPPEEEKDDDEKDDEKKDDEEKDEDDGGGHNSGNGPDDGHGN